MPSLAEIVDTPGNRCIAIDSADELIAALERIATDHPEDTPLVTVVRKDGDMLSIGLGRQYSVLSFVGASQDPPYFVSVGDINPSGDVVFYFNGHYSEFPPHAAVSPAEALEAVRAFVASAGLPLPSNVSWEEV